MRLPRTFACAVLAAVMVSTAWAADAPPATGSVSGSIVLKDGKAAAGAKVTALSTGDRSHDPVAVKTITANNDGTFKVDALAPGGYIFKFASGDQAANKSTTVIAGKDVPLGKITLKTVTTEGMKVPAPKTSGPRG